MLRSISQHQKRIVALILVTVLLILNTNVINALDNVSQIDIGESSDSSANYSPNLGLSSGSLSLGASLSTFGIAPYAIPGPDDYLSTNLTKYDVGGTNGLILFSDIGQYKFQIFGNSNAGGYDTGGGIPKYNNINIDSTVGTFNSTNMYYEQEGATIKKAYLYVGQSWFGGTPPTVRSGFIMGPSGNKVFLDDPYVASANGNTMPALFYDITDFVAEEGTGYYWGADLDFRRASPPAGTWDALADWQIIVVEEDSAFNYRQLLLKGFSLQMQNAGRTISTNQDDPTKKLYPPSGPATGQYLVSLGGGNAGFAGDYAIIKALTDNVDIKTTTLSEPAAGRTAGNFFSGIISKNGARPTTLSPYRNPTNLDLLVSDFTDPAMIPVGFDNVSFTASTGNDRVYLYSVGISVDVGAPNIKGNLNISPPTAEHTLSGNSVNIPVGERVVVNYAFEDADNGFTLDNPSYRAIIPEGLALDLGSIVITGYPNPTFNYNPITGELIIVLDPGVSLSDINISYAVNVLDTADSPCKISSYIDGKNVLPDGTITTMDISIAADTATINPGHPIIVKHLAEDSSIFAPQTTIAGYYGKAYATAPVVVPGFEIVATPGNATGTHGYSPQTVTYVYKRSIADMLIYHYGEDPTVLLDSETQTLTIGSAYNFLPITPTGFTVNTSKLPANASGTVPTGGDTVNFYYTRDSYSVVFNGNGALSGSMLPQTYRFGVPATLTPNTFQRQGYTFVGWGTSPSGLVVYSNEQSLSLTGNITLYAVWAEDPASWELEIVSVDRLNFGTQPVSSASVDYTLVAPVNVKVKDTFVASAHPWTLYVGATQLTTSSGKVLTTAALNYVNSSGVETPVYFDSSKPAGQQGNMVELITQGPSDTVFEYNLNYPQGGSTNSFVLLVEGGEAYAEPYNAKVNWTLVVGP